MLDTEWDLPVGEVTYFCFLHVPLALRVDRGKAGIEEASSSGQRRGPSPYTSPLVPPAWLRGKQRKRRRKSWRRPRRKRSYAWPNSTLSNSDRKVSRGLIRPRTLAEPAPGVAPGI